MTKPNNKIMYNENIAYFWVLTLVCEFIILLSAQYIYTETHMKTLD